MIEKNSVQKMTHDLSNKFMILEGYITLMQMDTKHISPETIQKLADTLAIATEILNRFKSNEEHKFLSVNIKK